MLPVCCANSDGAASAVNAMERRKTKRLRRMNPPRSLRKNLWRRHDISVAAVKEPLKEVNCPPRGSLFSRKACSPERPLQLSEKSLVLAPELPHRHVQIEVNPRSEDRFELD